MYDIKKIIQDNLQLTLSDDDLWEGNWYKDLPSHIQRNRKVVMTICCGTMHSSWEIESINKLIDVFTTNFSEDEVFMFEYLSNSSWGNEFFLYASDIIQSNYQLLILYLRLGHPEATVDWHFVYINENVKRNKQLMTRIVKEVPNTFISFIDELKDDIEISRLAIRADGLLLEYASQRLRSNEELVRIAIKGNIKAVLFADKNLRKEFDGVFYEDYWKVINGVL
jgi:hypothetical protein